MACPFFQLYWDMNLPFNKYGQRVDVSRIIYFLTDCVMLTVGYICTHFLFHI